MLSSLSLLLTLISPLLTHAMADDAWQGKVSVYTPIIQKIEAAWPIQGLSQLGEQKEALKVEALSTDGNAFFIGVVQMTTIKAPLSAVTDFLDHFENYPHYFDGLKKAQVLESKKEDDQNCSRIFFEQGVPVPFVPNDKSELLYFVKMPDLAHAFYRYQLHDGNNLISNDGMIVLDAISTHLTRYVEFDFWDAHWGIAKTFGAKKIWENSLQGLVQSDLAIKLRAENKDWDEKRVLSESKKIADDYPTEDRFNKRVDAKVWLKSHGIDIEK